MNLLRGLLIHIFDHVEPGIHCCCFTSMKPLSSLVDVYVLTTLVYIRFDCSQKVVMFNLFHTCYTRVNTRILHHSMCLDVCIFCFLLCALSRESDNKDLNRDYICAFKDGSNRYFRRAYAHYFRYRIISK